MYSPNEVVCVFLINTGKWILRSPITLSAPTSISGSGTLFSTRVGTKNTYIQDHIDLRQRLTPIESG